MAEQNVGEHLEKEIEELTTRLEAKKKELQAARPEQERELFREVFRERFHELQKAIQESVPSAPKGSVSSPQEESVSDLKKEETVQKLVIAAFEKGPREAIREAKRMDDFWVDELHDRLADEYYEKLLEFRKIRKL